MSNSLAHFAYPLGKFPNGSLFPSEQALEKFCEWFFFFFSLATL